MDFFEILQNHAAVFLLVLVRISGIFIMAPFLGSINIPQYVRVGTALVISIVMFPSVDAISGTQPVPPTVIGYAALVLKELFVGWLIGFVAYLSFATIHMAGKVMDMQVGFSIVNVMDPSSGQQIPLIGSFLYNLSVIVFLVTNGHHVLLTALIRSFQSVPLQSMSADPSIAELITRFTVGIFTTGMQIALPVSFAILLTNVGLGILARTMPQLNIFVVGVPLQIVVGLFMLSIVVPFYVLFLDVLFNEVYGNISLVLRAI